MTKQWMFDYFDQSRMNGQGMVLTWEAALWVIGRKPAALFVGELAAATGGCALNNLRLDHHILVQVTWTAN